MQLPLLTTRHSLVHPIIFRLTLHKRLVYFAAQPSKKILISDFSETSPPGLPF